VVALATLLVVPATANAADWLPAQTVTVGELRSDPQVALDPAGNTWVTWAQEVEVAPGENRARIFVARIDAGGEVGPSIPVSPAVTDFGTPGSTDGSSEGPFIGVDAGGAATAIWDRHIPGVTSERIEARRIQPDGTLGTVHTIVPRGDDHLVVVDDAGTATVGYKDLDDNSGVNYFARRLDPSDTLGGPQLLTGALPPADGVGVLRLAVGRNGLVSAVWSHSDSVSGDSVIELRQVDAGGTLVGSTPAVLSDTTAGFDIPALAADAQGNAVAMWTRSNGTTQFVEARHIPAAGPLGPTRELFSTAGFPGDLRIGLAPSGDATGIWEAPGGGSEIKGNTLSATDAAGSVFNVGTTEDFVELAMSGATPFVAARFNDGTDDRVRAASLGVGGQLVNPRLVSSVGVDAFDHQIGFSSEGTGAAIWGENPSGLRALKVALYDQTPPSIDAVLAPASGQPGQELGFGAEGDDRLTGEPAFAWDFGDGTTGTGQVVTHAYAAPGTYTVTLTVTDGASNTNVQTRTVTIAPSPGGGGGGGGVPDGGTPGTVPAQIPEVRLSRRIRQVRVGRTGTFSLPLAAQPASSLGSVRVDTVSRPRTRAAARFATGRFLAFANERTTLRLKLSRARLRTLTRRKTLNVRATITLRSLTGNTATETFDFRLLAPRARR
jgi:hypothetical protein